MTDNRIGDISLELAVLQAEADALETTMDDSSSTDLVAVDPQAKKKELQAQRANLSKVTAAIKAKAEELRKAADSQIAAARAAQEPLLAQIAQLEEAIEAIGLYLGMSESIICLREGEPAAASVPITVRQLVLYADEEAALGTTAALDTTLAGGIDSVSMKVFDEWLLADPAHLDQIIPEERGIVAVRPRRSHQRDEARREKDMVTHYVIRNGQDLYRTKTDSFQVGDMLVPARQEMEDLFTRLEKDENGNQVRVPLLPGSFDWDRAEAAAEAATRHFYKIVLVLEGLLTRTAVFAPLPAAGMSFIGEQSYEQDQIRVVTDGDPSLILEDGLPTFKEYQQELNALLEPGMRVVGAFDAEVFTGLSSGQWASEHRRLSPRSADRPETLSMHTVERSKSGQFRFLYARTGWRGSNLRRASCEVRATDDWILPIDLVDVDTLRYYLRSRLNRVDYLWMVPLITAAIEIRLKEDVEEQPFVSLLTSACQAATPSFEVDSDLVADLVGWWKTKRRVHRPLTGDEESKAYKEIVAEHQRRAKQAAKPYTDLTDTLHGKHPDALFIARKADRTWMVATPHNHANIYLRLHPYSITGKPRPVQEWRTYRYAWKQWEYTYSSDHWESWNREATGSHYLTDPEEAELVSEVFARLGSQAVMPTRHFWNQEKGKHGSAPHKFEPIAAVTRSKHTHYATRRHHYSVWTLGSPSTFDADRPVSVKGEEPGFLKWTVAWERPGGKLFVDVHTDRAYETRDRPDLDRAIFQDAKTLAVIAEQYDAWEQHLEARETLAGRARRLARQLIEQVWIPERKQAAFDAFVEKYGDASLWEDHSKSMSFSWPEHADQDRLEKVVVAALEDDVVLTGVSVAGAMMDMTERGRDPVSEVDPRLARLCFPKPEQDNE